MSQSAVDPVHPVLGFARALSGALDRVLASEPTYLTADEQREVLVGLEAQQARLDALKLKVLAAADRNDVGADSGATSTGAWLAHETLADRPEVVGRVKLARALDDEHRLTQQGLAAGDFSREHAVVIVRALSDLAADLASGLPEGVDTDVLVRAEKTLVEEAAHLTPRQLRTVGRHLLEVVAPDASEAREQARLDRQDAAAYANARFSMRVQGDGTTIGWFRLPDLHAAILKGALDAICAPRKNDKPDPDPVTDRVPDHATLAGQALCEILEHLPVDGYGEHGGLAATVLVTLDHDTLVTGLGAAALVDGTEISAGEARRLACGAGIVPVVLGGPSAVLDLGREQRLFTRAQRVAVALRDKGCRAEGCDRPPAWTEIHHLDHWSNGGKTDLANAISLCGHHHRLIHHPDYTHTRHPNGDIRCRRRTSGP